MRQILANITAAVFIISASGLFIAYILNRRIFPLALQTVAISKTGDINRALSYSLTAFAGASPEKPTDFYSATLDNSGKLVTIAVNPIAVNRVCNDLAEKITTRLEALGDVTVRVPLGAALGGGFFSAITPEIPFTVSPVGAVTVDYESEIASAGINRVNYKIWLNLRARVRVVNAMRDCQTVVTRRVALVDTVFAGDVPGIYLEGTK